MYQFYGIKEKAKNLSNGDKGNYTLEQFKSMFPEFTYLEEDVRKTIIPEEIIQSYIDMANELIAPSRFGAMWKLCVGWWVAHRIVQYLKTYDDSQTTPNIKKLVGKSMTKGNVSQSHLGDTSISYDNKSTTDSDAKWGELNQTIYGQQLIAQARLIGMGGSYVI